MGKPASEPLPLALRIDLAEAFVELSWERIKPTRRSIILDARWRHEHAEALAAIDKMLEAMLAMYDQRALEQAS